MRTALVYFHPIAVRRPRNNTGEARAPVKPLAFKYGSHAPDRAPKKVMHARYSPVAAPLAGRVVFRSCPCWLHLPKLFRGRYTDSLDH